jgi:hypothetical protein
MIHYGFGIDNGIEGKTLWAAAQNPADSRKESPP